MLAVHIYMIYKIYVMKILCACLLLQFCIINVSTYVKVKMMASVQSSIDNKYQTSGALEIYEGISRFDCLQDCNANTQCVSFFFKEAIKKCILHSTTFWRTTPAKSGTGWKFYLTADGKILYPAESRKIHPIVF